MTGIQAPEYISDSGSDNVDFTLHRALCRAIWTRERRALRPCVMPVDCLPLLARLAPALVNLRFSNNPEWIPPTSSDLNQLFAPCLASFFV